MNGNLLFTVFLCLFDALLASSRSDGPVHCGNGYEHRHRTVCIRKHHGERITA